MLFCHWTEEKKLMICCVYMQTEAVAMMRLYQNIKKLIATRGDKDYYVRGTFTKHNLDFAKDAVHMAELGFDQVFGRTCGV